MAKSSHRRTDHAEDRDVFRCVHAVDAIYHQEGLLPEHASNHLVSCLGPYWTDKDIAKKVGVSIGFDESERERSKEYRMHAVARLGELVVSLPAHLDVVHTIHRIIREHYAHESILDNGLDAVRDRYRLNSSSGQLQAVYEHRRSHAYCAAFFGYSGAGKTTAVESALRLLPWVVRHPQYGVMQVVRIKIDCPRSASLKDTLKLLLETYDDLLDTHYVEELSSRATLADYANKVHRVARRHHTGVIVLDEIQNALNAAAGADPLFDFFVNLTNLVGVPIVVCGTPRAERLFRTTLRLARRVSSQGVTVWRGIHDATDWNRLCDELSKYQWLTNSKPLSAAERKYLWSLTQGLPGVAIPLYQLSQYAAIASGRERLSCRLFKSVFDEKMRSLKPILRAIRSGRKVDMMRYDDILGDTLKEVVADMKAEAQHNLFYDALSRHDRIEVSIDAVSSLIVAGIPREIAEKMVDLVQKEFPSATRAELCHEVSLRYYSTRESLLKTKDARKDKEAEVETIA
ncbi:ATP-binding protein [Caballeronia sp. J97]|uniref:ATP-binding protein n=1 Tax=Caballeronia sp. J97 TaxID=2805429 RepID=UPI002AB13742|nr:ATP-binding protein [Caballeronia sp. J97]